MGYDRTKKQTDTQTEITTLYILDDVIYGNSWIQIIS